MVRYTDEALQLGMKLVPDNDKHNISWNELAPQIISRVNYWRCDGNYYYDTSQINRTG